MKAPIHCCLFALLLVCLLPAQMKAQVAPGAPKGKPSPPVTVEPLFGNNRLAFQMVVKKPFAPDSKFSFFSVASYAASYVNDKDENEMVMPVQISYSFGKGFGLMGGATIQSKAGFSPIAGPQHNFANKNWLAVTVVSFVLSAEDPGGQFFGLYEYRPAISPKWNLYTRVQGMYVHSFSDQVHERSYVHMRLGLKRKAAAFGLGANLDRYEPTREFKPNYGIFLRWDLI